MATKPKPFRILGLDLSITSPGFAVVDVKKGAASLVTTAHFKTAAATPQALRYEEIEAFALLFIRDHMPFDVVVREIWPPSRNYSLNNKVHGAWSAVDRALLRYGYEVDTHYIPSSVKLSIAGAGNAKKPEVAQGVRDILRLDDDYAFKTDDHSDAAAVALTYCVREKLITIGEDD